MFKNKELYYFLKGVAERPNGFIKLVSNDGWMKNKKEVILFKWNVHNAKLRT